MFFLHDGNEDLAMKGTQMIANALIKMKNTGLYAKAIEKWGKREAEQRKQWSDFRAFMIEQYEKMLRSNEGPTAGDIEEVIEVVVDVDALLRDCPGRGKCNNLVLSSVGQESTLGPGALHQGLEGSDVELGHG